MNALGVILMIFLFGLPISWIVAEFKAGRSVRISLGILSILLSLAVAWFVGTLERLNYNAWYGTATQELVETIIVKLENGEQQKVIKSLKSLQNNYRPTYENRAHYDELAKEAVKVMK